MFNVHLHLQDGISNSTAASDSVHNHQTKTELTCAIHSQEPVCVNIKHGASLFGEPKGGANDTPQRRRVEDEEYSVEDPWNDVEANDDELSDEDQNYGERSSEAELQSSFEEDEPESEIQGNGPKNSDYEDYDDQILEDSESIHVDYDDSKSQPDELTSSSSDDKFGDYDDENEHNQDEDPDDQSPDFEEEIDSISESHESSEETRDSNTENSEAKEHEERRKSGIISPTEDEQFPNEKISQTPSSLCVTCSDTSEAIPFKVNNSSVSEIHSAKLKNNDMQELLNTTEGMPDYILHESFNDVDFDTDKEEGLVKPQMPTKKERKINPQLSKNQRGYAKNPRIRKLRPRQNPKKIYPGSSNRDQSNLPNSRAPQSRNPKLSHSRNLPEGKVDNRRPGQQAVMTSLISGLYLKCPLCRKRDHRGYCRQILWCGVAVVAKQDDD